MKNTSPALPDLLDDEEYLITRNDAQGKITYVNERWEHVTGYTLDELRGASTKVLYHADMPDQVGADVWATLARGCTWTGLQKLRRKDGSGFWTLTTVAADVRHGAVVGYVSVRTHADSEQAALAETAYGQWKAGTKGRYAIRSGAVVARGSVQWLSTALGPRAWRVLAVLASGVLGGSAAFALQRLSPLDAMQGADTALIGAAAGVLLYVAREGRKAARSLTEALDAVRLFSAGDLSRAVPAGKQDYRAGRLAHTLDVMRRGFLLAVSDMRAGSFATRHAAGEIASATADLSNRAARQSAALEQAAVAIEELSQAVQNNRDNTTEAHARMRGATALAAQGLHSAQEADNTMLAVSTQAHRIAGISATIESIAFQTSILALNASVEAARAGAEGRGFAVVAAEVRALSQRSAEAAKEIGEVVSNALAQIDAGASQVVANSRTIERLAAAIAEVEGIVASIADATHQQSLAAGEIGGKVSELSESVAQTTAMVNEAATAAQALLDQSSTLDVAMAAFRLRETDR